MKNVSDSGSADYHDYNWVDQFDTLGLGPNVPIAPGSGSKPEMVDAGLYGGGYGTEGGNLAVV